MRLTPDRQSKSGTLWADSTFNSGEFVTTIKFRISGQVSFLYAVYGQGSSLFGDGFAVFFTKHRSPIPVSPTFPYNDAGKDVFGS